MKLSKREEAHLHALKQLVHHDALYAQCHSWMELCVGYNYKHLNSANDILFSYVTCPDCRVLMLEEMILRWGAEDFKDLCVTALNNTDRV